MDPEEIKSGTIDAAQSGRIKGQTRNNVRLPIPSHEHWLYAVLAIIAALVFMPHLSPVIVMTLSGALLHLIAGRH